MRFRNDPMFCYGGVGERFKPPSAGLPGTNNHVVLTLIEVAWKRIRNFVNLLTQDSIPEYPAGMNTVTVINKVQRFSFLP